VTEDTGRADDGDTDLVRRCAEGDARAWASFVDRFGPLIAALARRMLVRRSGRAAEADVDEVSAEVFLALVRRDRLLLKRYDPTYRVSTYLGVICRTEVNRHLRKAGRELPGLPEAERLGEAQPSPGPLEALAGAEQRAAAAELKAALQRLQERDRMLLTLRFLEGRNYREIGEALGVAADSVGQLLTRAKGRLAGEVPHLRSYLTDNEQ
jgi:RNA polymerase sigma factor (sigma-70 family)